MILRARVKDGKVVTDDPILLPDGTSLEIHVVGEKNAADERDRQWMQQFIGCMNHLPPNASTTVDEVLYGGKET